MYVLRRVLLSCAFFLVLAACAGGGEEPCVGEGEPFQTCCGGNWVFLTSDFDHCGMCDSPCRAGQTCGGGACTGGGGFDAGPGGFDSGPTPSGCVGGQRCCGTNCFPCAVPLNTDGRSAPSFENCNGCGIACDSQLASACSVPAGGTTESAARCMCGEFNACFAGEVCASEGGRFTCLVLSTDPNNCGAVGNRCASGESCSGGMCVCGSTGARCGAGEGCCGGACVDLSDNQLNCGACGNVCTPNSPDCVSGSCICAASGRVCTSPMAGAGPFGGGSPGESCCPGTGCVANTDTNCACEACTGDDTCQVGGSGFFPGGGGTEAPTVCCGGDEVAFLGCMGFGFPGSDGGFFPMGDGGFSFPDGGSP
jgi:hypothetical protein